MAELTKKQIAAVAKRSKYGKLGTPGECTRNGDTCTGRGESCVDPYEQFAHRHDQDHVSVRELLLRAGTRYLRGEPSCVHAES